MKKTVKIRNVIIGESVPKICVPLVGGTLPQLKEEAEFIKTLHPDLVEWRADFFEGVEDIEQIIATLKELNIILKEIPLIFTFRSLKEGGEKEISADVYFSLNEAIVQTGFADVIDIELFHDERNIKALVKSAHDNDVLVIISNHDFDRTPEKEEIISRLQKAQELGADLPKIAVMPETPADVLTLLEATHLMNEQFAERPIITMSMAGKGLISRLAGEVFGSALTFAAAKKGSAPGQIAVTELRQFLAILHDNL
ncbi:type I 3-dehydroquinate dehydratase [Bacillus sp. CLL-7-23]|uniref:3-dehydroquinate dehydratase n=1 Tax=Bacillus changyiensis TaxID=3004103 RepID=A0ABT4X8Z3_9BACI|nr:type I 3-dehydroquinate dehydratase [Bacillus changyiensis]MDA7028214.1 type I 3-dehydroquinate dehydratase [Bacillus changyiensis]